jgi:non-specific serine/threonine protein kinase
VTGNDAVTLFVERAASVYPGSHVDDVNASTVAGICRRLDGIPLALELAAGRLRALSLEQLLLRLDARYEVLIGGSRAALPRQQTMRALIDWSYALCTPAEQLLWARLSVFAGGFRLDTAEQVCADDQLRVFAVLDTLEGLVDKSIVSADRVRTDVRYRLAETLREYGADRLEPVEARIATRRRARDWCARLVDGMVADWFSSRQPDLLHALRAEHGNIQAALDFCLTQPGESRVGLRIAAGMWHYWTASGRLSEGRLWLDRLLAQSPDPTAERLRALCVCAHLTNATAGGAEDVDRMLDEAASLARDLGDAAGAAFVAQVRGVVMLFRAEPSQAAVLFGWAADEHRRLNNVGSLAHDLAMLGSAERAAGQSDVSTVLEECVSLCRAAGENWIRAIALFTLGVELCIAGDLAGATAAQRESLELRIPLDVHYSMALNLDALAWIAVEQADHERAARMFGAAEAVMRDVGGVLLSQGPTAPRHEIYQARAREALGPNAFTAAYDAGLRMGFDNAIAYALGVPGTPTAPSAAPAVDSDTAPGLTAREKAVAKLVARGLTNKQIAATLVISQRTAEGHVEHVLTKLGFTSRAQIAAWVAERDSRQPTTEG